ncbi:MAG: tryptophan-rich sensory protein [Anaerolineaceae bacterium]
MNKLSIRQILVIVSALLTIAMNILANALPLNGQNTGEISDRFKVLFVPAGYVFSIWGIIYIGLIAFAVYQALPQSTGNSRLVNIADLFIGSCIANIAWLFFWHYNLFALTLIAMLSLLVLLIMIVLRLYPGRKEATSIEKWAVDYPFSLYLGWITVATIANVTDVLYYYNWNGFGMDPMTWASLMMVIAAGIVFAVYARRKDLVFPIPIIWAIAGIAVKFKDNIQLSGSAWAIAGLIVFSMVALDLAKKLKAGSEIPPPGMYDNNGS